MTGYEQFLQIMAEINNKIQLEELNNKNSVDTILNLFRK